MVFARLALAAAVGLILSPASADPRTLLAKLEVDGPAQGADTAATAPLAAQAGTASGHEASDAALSAAVETGLPEEVEQAEPLQPPEPTLFATINLTSQTMTVRDAAGSAYGPWKISSARGGYSTPTGTYSVSWTSRMHYSKQYHWSPMPHAVFFTRGVAVHGTNAIGSLGRPASHGCVRLHPKNAKTFYDLVERHGIKLTRIAVEGKPPYTPVVAERIPRRSYQEPAFSPFGFFAEPPSYQPAKRRTGRQQQYGGGYYGAW